MQALFNRPPSIAEDTLYYALYPQYSSSDKTSVTAMALSVQNLVETLLSDFLWHRDTFQVKVVQNSDGPGWFIEGRMRVGDCIDDEWCVVWLLREVSARWDFAISVRDSDGEFLLIEAADTLPSWVTPSVVENRVWIYKSHLHLIPLSHVSPPSSRRRHVNPSIDDEDITLTEAFLSISDALNLVRDTSVETQTPGRVEQTVWQRIERYPQNLPHHVHNTKAYLPVDIAKALSSNPALVQRAAETFYTRDAAQLRSAHKMARFPPQPCLLQIVRLTRTAYAQLAGQRFYPPKVFGRWQEKEGTPEWRWRDLGLKISCGFEMLYQEVGTRGDIPDTSLRNLNTAIQARKDALQRDPEYTEYIRSIQAAGYFRGEIEGSQLWNELEIKALEVFLQSRREDDASRPSFASQVNVAIAKANDLEPSQDIEDPDDWLTVDAEDFDSALQEKMSHNGPNANHGMDVDPPPDSEDKGNGVTKAQVARLQDLANKVDAFVSGKGDVEGALFEDEKSSGEDASDFSDEGFSGSEVGSDDNEESANAVRQDAMEKLVPGIEPSEYGRMPASFYDRSQRIAPTKPVDELARVESEGLATETNSPFAPSRPVRAPILTRDHYEGVDSDDDSDEENELADNDEDDEDEPQLVGEIEVDMAEEEEEFLEFSRQTLGITDEHWQQILRERKERGAFVPTYVAEESYPPVLKDLAQTAAKAESGPRHSAAVSRTGGNPNLDSFESVMQAMDEELARLRSQKAPTSSLGPSPESKGKGKERAQDVDIETAMDDELRDALEHEEDDEVELDGEGGTDYNLIKNFLESFKSQAGLSGPVSNLAGRLQPGWALPRDEL